MSIGISEIVILGAGLVFLVMAGVLVTFVVLFLNSKNRTEEE